MELGEISLSMIIWILPLTQNSLFSLSLVCYYNYAIIRLTIFDWCFGIKTWSPYNRNKRREENNSRKESLDLP
jgi:hypothetical protein